MRDPWILISPHILAIIFVMAIRAQKCGKGANECTGNTLRVCTDEGYWSEMPCPGSTSCVKSGAKMAVCKNGKDETASASDNPPEPKKDKGKQDDVSIGEPQSNKTDEPAPKKPAKDRKNPASKDSKDPAPIDNKDAAKATVTITKAPKQIELSTGNKGPDGKEVVYNIVLNNGKGVTPNIAQMSIQSSPNPSVPSGDPGAGAPPSAGASPTPAPSGSPSPAPGAAPTPTPDAGGAAPSPAGSPSPAPGAAPTPTPDAGGAAPSPAPSTGGAAPSPAPDAGGASSSSSSAASSAAGGAGSLTLEKLKPALKEAGVTPKDQIASALLKEANAHFKDKVILAMFLAQVSHETELAHLEELDCLAGKCAGKYGTGAPNKSYHGRGFIQLTWPDNYKKAGAGIGMGEKLYQEPELVSKDPTIAAKTAIWYWDKIVMEAPGVKDKKLFGLTTKAINGPLECKPGPGSDKSKRRYKLYKAISKAMGLTEVAAEGGCYTA